MEQAIRGWTDQARTVFIPDPASTTGQGKTGLVAADLKVTYVRRTASSYTVTDVTSLLNDLAAITDAHNDWGVKELSATLSPGLYRIDLADAVFAAFADEAVLYVMLSTGNAAATPKQFILGDYTTDTIGANVAVIRNSQVSFAGLVDDVTPADTVFDTTLTGFGDDFFKDTLFVFASDAAGVSSQARTVLAYVSATGTFVFDEPFTAVPANGADFTIRIEHNHPISQIVAAVVAGLLPYWQVALRQDAAIAADRAAQITLINTDEGSGPGAFNPTVNPVVEVSAGSQNDIADVLDPANRFRDSLKSITKFTVGAASTTTNIVTSALAPAAATIDQYKGLVLAFAEDTTTAALRGQKTEVTASAVDGQLTVTALTTAPVSGDYGTIS